MNSTEYQFQKSLGSLRGAGLSTTAENQVNMPKT